MPRGDGTGPMGEGSLTGRGLGNCDFPNKEKSETQEVVTRGTGLGRGIGLGRGAGCRKGRRGDQRGCGRRI